jgi:hypothetical protein
LFNEVCRRNLEGVVAKRKTETYSTISGWLKIKNPNYTQSEQRHELFKSFKAKTVAPQRSADYEKTAAPGHHFITNDNGHKSPPHARGLPSESGFDDPFGKRW